MEVINDRLYMLWAELQVAPYHVPEETLKKGTVRFRAGLSQSWRCYNAPADLRQVLIEYCSIPKVTVRKHGLPPEAQLLAQYRREEALLPQQREAAREFIRQRQAREVLQAAVAKPPRAARQPYEHLRDGMLVNDYARAHAVIAAVLVLIDPLADMPYKLKELFKPFQQLELARACYKHIGTFYARVKACKDAGIPQTLLHGNQGNDHAGKAGDFHRYVAEAYYSLPYKYTFGLVTAFVNCHAAEYELAEISESWVSTYLNQREVKNRLLRMRHGEREYTNRLKGYLHRQGPLHAGDLWLMDGTPLQLVCWNAERTEKIRLTLFIVLDVFSHKVVGYDLSLKEDRYSALSALEAAVKRTEIAPYELVYDNFSGGKTDEYQHVKRHLEARGVIFRASKVGNPQDKAQVERWFGTFQTRFCQHVEGYFGEGIKTRRLDGKPHEEFLNRVYELNGVPNLDTMKARIVELVEQYNGTALGKGRLSPNKLFAGSEKPSAYRLEHWDRALLFWPTKTVTVRNGLLRLEVRKQEYVYALTDAARHLELSGGKVTVRYNLEELADPAHAIYLFEVGTENYLGECQLATAVAQAQANQTQASLTAIQQQGKREKALEREIATRNAAVAERGMREVGADGKLAMLGAKAVGKYDRDEAETEMMLDHLAINRQLVTPEPAPVAHLGNDFFEQHGAGLSAQDRYAGRLRTEGDGSVWKPRHRDDDD